MRYSFAIYNIIHESYTNHYPRIEESYLLSIGYMHWKGRYNRYIKETKLLHMKRVC